MKTTLTTILLSILTVSMAGAATPWWHQPTICKLNPNKCYPGVITGVDSEMWDTGSNCWGQKIICAAALNNNTTENTPLEKQDIKGKIKNDFDASLLSADGDCFGRRITSKDGSMAQVNGKLEKIWCNGVLSNPGEEIENGEIATSAPTCQELANNGYVAVQNKNCYGKVFDLNKYHIQCGQDTKSEPKQLIVLNGADWSNKPNTNIPQKQVDADNLFDTMFATSQEQQKKYIQ